MIHVIANHDVDDVPHWFDSPKRDEFFGARGMKATPFRDPAGDGSCVAVLIETPDIETLQKAFAEPDRRGRAARWCVRRHHPDLPGRVTGGDGGVIVAAPYADRTQRYDHEIGDDT